MERNIVPTISNEADNKDIEIRENIIAVPAPTSTIPRDNRKPALVERQFFPISLGLNSDRSNEQGRWWENPSVELVERQFFPIPAGSNSSRANEQGRWWEDPSLSHRDNFVNLGDPIPGNEQMINTQLELGANVQSTFIENEHGRKRQKTRNTEGAN